MKPVIYTIKDPTTDENLTGTARELCNRFGVPLRTAQRRLYTQKWPAQRAFTEKQPPEETMTVTTPDGEVITGTLNELCKKFDMKRNVVRSRITKYGMDLYTALTKPSQYENYITVTDPITGNSYTDTKAALMRKFDANTNTIRHRIQSGLTFEQALFLQKPHARRPRPNGVFEVKDPATGNMVKGTYHELIKHFDAVEGTVFYRMCNGMPLEMALTRPTNYTKKRHDQ